MKVKTEINIDVVEHGDGYYDTEEFIQITFPTVKHLNQFATNLAKFIKEEIKKYPRYTYFQNEDQLTKSITIPEKGGYQEVTYRKGVKK